MKKHVVVFILSLLCCVGCSTQRCLQKRSDRLVERLLNKVDTVYSYGIAFNDFNLIWYQKDSYLYSFFVKPYKAKEAKPVKIKDIDISKEEMDKYFKRDNPNYDLLCFPFYLLDGGETIIIYIKDKDKINSLWRHLDSDCLFSTKFETNTSPYRLQYVFSKIWRPMDFDFEKIVF